MQTKIMSGIMELIDTLEKKAHKLITKLDSLEQVNQELKIRLTENAKSIEIQSIELQKIKAENETLKIANALLGSDENKRDTKFKINSLIREIDSCIIQLSD